MHQRQRMTMYKARKTARQSQEAERPVLTRSVPVDDITDGEEGLVEATETERTAMARLLDLVALDRLAFSYRLQREGEGRVGLTGTLAAAVTQTCVITLEPARTALDVPVSLEFWPPRLIGELKAKTEEPPSHGLLDWPEPIIEGKIDLGPVIYESFATALDLYPRKEGASFTWRDDATKDKGAEKAAGPFAALEKLKRR